MPFVRGVAHYDSKHGRGLRDSVRDPGRGVDPDRAVAARGSVAFVGDSHAADYVGPLAAGMDAYLIDPDDRHDVPPDHRLASVLDIEARSSERPNR